MEVEKKISHHLKDKGDYWPVSTYEKKTTNAPTWLDDTGIWEEIAVLGFTGFFSFELGIGSKGHYIKTKLITKISCTMRYLRKTISKFKVQRKSKTLPQWLKYAHVYIRYNVT